MMMYVGNVNLEVVDQSIRRQCVQYTAVFGIRAETPSMCQPSASATRKNVLYFLNDPLPPKRSNQPWIHWCAVVCSVVMSCACAYLNQCVSLRGFGNSPTHGMSGWIGGGIRGLYGLATFEVITELFPTCDSGVTTFCLIAPGKNSVNCT